MFILAITSETIDGILIGAAGAAIAAGIGQIISPVVRYFLRNRALPSVQLHVRLSNGTELNIAVDAHSNDSLVDALQLLYNAKALDILQETDDLGLIDSDTHAKISDRIANSMRRGNP